MQQFSIWLPSRSLPFIFSSRNAQKRICWCYREWLDSICRFPKGMGKHKHSVSLSQCTSREVSVRQSRPHRENRGPLKCLSAWIMTENRSRRLLGTPPSSSQQWRGSAGDAAAGPQGNAMNVTNGGKQLVETEPCKGISSEACDKNRISSIHKCWAASQTSFIWNSHTTSSSVTLSLRCPSTIGYCQHTHMGSKKVRLVRWEAIKTASRLPPLRSLNQEITAQQHSFRALNSLLLPCKLLLLLWD